MGLSEAIGRPREAAAERVRGPRRVVKVAITAIQAIYRTGRGVGRVKARRAEPLSKAKAGAAFTTGAATGVGTAFFLDPQSGPRRRRLARNKVAKLARRGPSEAGSASG